MNTKTNDAKLYFVTGSFSSAGAVKVMNADAQMKELSLPAATL